MKFLVEAVMPTETGNKKLKDGSLMKLMKSYLGDIKPDAVYFSIAHGKRTIFLIVNVSSSEKLPEIAEPLWLGLNAEVFFTPIMDAQEFEKAGPAIQKIASKS